MAQATWAARSWIQPRIPCTRSTRMCKSTSTRRRSRARMRSTCSKTMTSSWTARTIFRLEGQATVFAYQGGPCYRCLYPEPPPPGLVPSCAEGGVLGILPGTIGLIQATEAVKLILGTGTTLVGRLMLYDALNMKFRELKLRKNPECPICGTHRTITKLIDYQEF